MTIIGCCGVSGNQMTTLPPFRADWSSFSSIYRMRTHPSRAIAEMMPYDVTLVVHGDIEIVKALLRHALDNDLEDGTAGDAQHWLRTVVGQRAQPLAAATGHEKHRIGPPRHPQRLLQSPQRDDMPLTINDRNLATNISPQHVQHDGRIVVDVRNTRACCS